MPVPETMQTKPGEKALHLTKKHRSTITNYF